MSQVTADALPLSLRPGRNHLAQFGMNLAVAWIADLASPWDGGGRSVGVVGLDPSTAPILRRHRPGVRQRLDDTDRQAHLTFPRPGGHLL